MEKGKHLYIIDPKNVYCLLVQLYCMYVCMCGVYDQCVFVYMFVYICVRVYYIYIYIIYIYTHDIYVCICVCMCRPLQTLHVTYHLYGDQAATAVTTYCCVTCQLRSSDTPTSHALMMVSNGSYVHTCTFIHG